MIKKRITIIFSLVGLVLVMAAGTSFAYIRVTRTQTDKNKISTASCLQIDFVGEDIINIPNAYPIKDNDGLSQTPYKFTISNVCSQNIEVSLGFESLPGSTLPLNYVKGIMAREGHLADTTIAFLNSYPNSTPQNNGIAKLMLTDSIPGLQSKTYEYTMWIDYNVTASDISPNDVLNGKIIATYVMKTANTFTKYCYTDDYEPGMTMTAGTEYVNGQYTYRFRQETNGVYDETSGNYPTAWVDIDEDGWGVTLTDKTSTDPVTSELCTFINDKPLVSMTRMFYESQATALDLSSYNTGSVKRMSSMFDNSNMNTSIDLSGLDLSNVEEMDYMFRNSKFTYLNFSNPTTKKVSSSICMFMDATINNLDMGNFESENILNTQSMFQSFTTTSLTLPTNFDLRKATNMSNMFFNSNIPNIDLKGLQTRDVTDVNLMFYNVTADNIDISGDFDLSKVKNFGSFVHSANIGTLDLSGLKTESVEEASYMFANSNITEVILPEHLDFKNATLLNHAFYSANIGSLDLSGFETRDVTDVSSLFQGFTSDHLVLPTNFDLRNVTDLSQIFYEAKVDNIDLSGLQTRDATTTARMFQYSTATTITFPSNTLDLKKVTDMSQMFFGCKAVNLDLSSFETRDLTTMSQMFNSSPSITSITFSGKFSTSNVTNMFDLFMTTNVTTLDISMFDTAKVTEMNYMFAECSQLTTVYASERWSTAKVTSHSSMFKGATKIKNYNKNYINKTRAHYNTNGYFTYKAAPTS